MNQADEVDGAKKGTDSTGKVKHIKKAVDNLQAPNDEDADDRTRRMRNWFYNVD